MSQHETFYRGTQAARQEIQKHVDINEMARVMGSIPPDPLASWMRKQGFDPSKGAILILPKSLAFELGAFPPHYVRVNELVAAPMMISPGIPAPVYDTAQ